jgi:hypothetical protein
MDVAANASSRSGGNYLRETLEANTLFTIHLTDPKAY